MRKTREVALFVHRGDEFLIAHRTNDEYWNVIAGQVEEGESFDDAAVRELLEETGLTAPLHDLRVTQVYDVAPEYRHLYAPGEYKVTVACYVVSAPSGWEPTLNDEHDSYQWCALEDAVALAHWPEVKAGFRLAAAALTK